MTREEAIDMLYGMKEDNLNLEDAYTKDKYDALEMAIKALEELPKRRKEAKRWRAKAHQIADESYKEGEYLKSAIRISKDIPKEAVLNAIHEAYMNAYDEQSLVRDLTQAVNELPPVKPQPCEDAISRQAVLDAIEDDNRNGMWSHFVSDCDAQVFKDVIRQLPSINPQEPKTGHPQKSCDTCEHSDEIDGSNCYECVKDMRNNYSPKKEEL